MVRIAERPLHGIGYILAVLTGEIGDHWLRGHVQRMTGLAGFVRDEIRLLRMGFDSGCDNHRVETAYHDDWSLRYSRSACHCWSDHYGAGAIYSAGPRDLSDTSALRRRSRRQAGSVGTRRRSSYWLRLTKRRELSDHLRSRPRANRRR